jgi:hypothetical protein
MTWEQFSLMSDQIVVALWPVIVFLSILFIAAAFMLAVWHVILFAVREGFNRLG